MIVTKFTIATGQSIDMLEVLTSELAREKFTGLVSPEILENYISKNFNWQTLLTETNSMSNQWLVVYVQDQPAGCARLTSLGKRPQSIADRGIIRIADFAILEKHSGSGARESLMEKCLAVGKRYEAIWANEFKENPAIDLFKHNGFIPDEGETVGDELPLPSIFLVKERA